MIKSDEQGFLVGDPVSIDRTLQIWDEIRKEMRLIRMAITGDNGLKGLALPLTKGIAEANKKIHKAVSQSVAQSKAIKDKVKPIATPHAIKSRSTLNAADHSKVESNLTARQKSNQVATPQRIDRDNKGRFVGGNNKRPSRTGSPLDDDMGSPRDRIIEPGDGEDNRFINSFAEKVAGVVNEARSGTEEIDPSIKAMNEIAQPMARGFELMTSGTGGRVQKRTEQWFRKIFGELKLFRKEDTVFNKAANKSLKNLEEKPVGGEGGGGLLSMFLLPIGVLATALVLLAKKIPGIGALFTSAGNILNMLNGGDKSKAVGGIAGTFAGMLGGAKAGSLIGSFAGPIGTAIGGVVGGLAGMFFGNEAGQIVGSKIGEWTDQLKQADIPGKIQSAWESFTTDMSNRISAGWDTVTNFIKDKFGIDVKAKVESAKEAVSSGMDAIKKSPVGRAAAKVRDKVRDKFNSATEEVSDMTKPVKDWFLGKTSKLFESGNKGAGTISSGKGDHGGVSYGTYQLSSKMGTLQKFLNSTAYGEQFKGLEPGTEEFNKKWKQLANDDPSFGSSQHDFIKSTHFDPQIAKLKRGGMDLPGRGKAVQDAIWSTSVQFGGNTSLIQKALHGKDVNELSDADIVKAIQKYKIDNNDTLFRSSSENVREGTLNRAFQEEKKLLALAGIDGTPIKMTQAMSSSLIGNDHMQKPVNSHASIPIAPKMPSPQKIAEAPSIPEPLTNRGINADRKPSVVAMANDVGQDVKDRGIAHIVTGGLSD